MNHSPRFRPDAHANVCLLLEGTYPYVRGGVSTWVRQLIEGMPELTFSIIFLGSQPGENDTLVYDLPDNLVHIEVHYLLEGEVEQIRPHPFSLKQVWGKHKGKHKHAQNNELHDKLAEVETTLDQSVIASFTDLLVGEDPLTQSDFQQNKFAWNTIRESYRNAPAGLDFNHYFWTVRGMHAPLFTLARIASSAPVADVYHSVSTGYAGFLGGMISRQTRQPYLITEHGIYTKERELDLAQVNWIPENADRFRVGLNDEMSYLRQVWIRFFASLGRMAYSAADEIFTLYEGNRIRQLADGAPNDKLSIIPNGVDVDRFRQARRAPQNSVPPVVALVGRVVPIKDIKTFIRAMRIVQARVPDAQGWLVGPQDEDPSYTQECLQLVDSLDLGDCIHFLGFQNPLDLFPKIGLSVLTSVSEGQPLVVLEGFAAGVPAVTTDVGSCRELVFGVTEDDKALGAAGSVVSISDPAAFADATIELLTNKSAWDSASAAAITRVERYYDEKELIERYRGVYTSAIDATGSLREAS